MELFTGEAWAALSISSRALAAEFWIEKNSSSFIMRRMDSMGGRGATRKN